jgi:hypothetical protein
MSLKMKPPIWKFIGENSPLVATAIHAGHALRAEVVSIMQLSEADRLREEDPFTEAWTEVAGTRIVGLHSRFEVDLNRPRQKAIYLEPEDAWGLQVWREKPSPDIVAGSLAQYDAFYAEVRRVLTGLEQQFGRFIVFDLHSYNHRRAGPAGPAADPAENPEVNVGTGTLDRSRWGPVVDRFIKDLGSFDFLGRHLDVRENVRFFGGQFPRWIHQTFPETGCALAIEFKKFFMDEWTGEPDLVQINIIREALQSTVPGVLEELGRL